MGRVMNVGHIHPECDLDLGKNSLISSATLAEPTGTRGP